MIKKKHYTVNQNEARIQPLRNSLSRLQSDLRTLSNRSNIGPFRRQQIRESLQKKIQSITDQIKRLENISYKISKRQFNKKHPDRPNPITRKKRRGKKKR